MHFLYTDGASRGNPGHSSYGFVIYDKQEREIDRGSGYIDNNTTNNKAEYIAVIQGMKRALMLELRRITVFTDSKIVKKQVTNEWACLARSLKWYRGEVRRLSREFGQFRIRLIPREKNKLADEMANKALERELGR